MVDKRIRGVAAVLLGVEFPTEIYDWVGFEVLIVVWQPQCDHFEVDVVVDFAVVHTAAASSTLEGFHGLCDIPINIKIGLTLFLEIISSLSFKVKCQNLFFDSPFQ